MNDIFFHTSIYSYVKKTEEKEKKIVCKRNIRFHSYNARYLRECVCDRLEVIH